MSRVLPFGGPSETNTQYRGAIKLVDRSNAFSKLSKRSPTDGSPSHVFDPPPTVVKPRVERHADPLQGGEEVFRRPQGLRITKMNEAIEARQQVKQDEGFRPSLRTGYSPVQVDDSNSYFTAFGQRYGGKAVGVVVNQESLPCKVRQSSQMQRFNLTPRTNSNVLLPQTLQDSTPKAKPQRFQSTSHRASLVGVLGNATNQAPRVPYKVLAPWSTNE